MGLARELSLGPNGGRRRRSPQPGSSVDYSALRRLTAARDPDLDTFRAVMLRVGQQAGRMRQAEIHIYARASERFHELTGEWLGPRLGIRADSSPCEVAGCEANARDCPCGSAHCPAHPHQGAL